MNLRANSIENVVNGKVSSFTPLIIQESAWYQHVPFLFWLIENMSPKSFLEMGVHNGVSYFTACEAVKQLQINTKCYALDHWHGDNQAGIFNNSIFDKFIENHKSYENFSEYIKDDFENAMKKIDDNSIELLHIDGFHSYTAAENDFNLAMQKIDKQKGIILLHDINEYQITFGVNKFWESLKGKFQFFQFNHGHGLGVIFIGTEIKTELLDSFYLNDAKKSIVFRNLFELLGQRVELFAENKMVKEKLEDRHVQLTTNHNLYKELEARMNEIIKKGEENLSSLQKSISWRITFPLRLISNYSINLLKNKRRIR
jgi:hypothetical protein